MEKKVLKGELTALGKIGKIVKALQDLDRALNEIVNMVAELIGADFCFLYLVDAEREELVLKAAKAVKLKNLSQVRVKIGKGFLGEVAQTKRIFLEEVKEPSRYDLPAWQRGVSSFLILPLEAEEKLVGVLDLRFFSPKLPTIERDLLSTLASEIAALIQGAKLFNETQKNLLEHQVLYEIGLLLTSVRELNEVLKAIVVNAMKIVRAPAGSLALYNQDKQEFSLAVTLGFSPDFSRTSKWKLRTRGLTRQILDQGGPLVIPDVTLNSACDNPVMIREGIKSLVALPLAWEKQTLGILYVDDFVPRNFTSNEISVLSLLANQATIAIMKTQLLEQTKRLAVTNGLTGVFNYRYFQERLKEEMKRAGRYHHHLSLIILDIDYFKNYNDRFGHPQGDVVLRKIAKILRKATREVDIVARYGGEEFVVILPETEKEEAVKVAEKIRQEVEETSFPGEETQPGRKITVSLGVATYPYDAQLQKELIDQTDQAMYLAKKRGRNRVCTLKDFARKTEFG